MPGLIESRAMTMNRIGIRSLVTALVLLLCVASAADARKHHRRSHAFDVTYRTADVSTSPDGSFVVAGVGSDGSALVVRGITTGNSVTDTATSFSSKGTQHTSDTFTATGNPDGSVSFSGSGKFLGGTGRYRGISGTYTISGTQAANDTVTVIRVHGTAIY